MISIIKKSFDPDKMYSIHINEIISSWKIITITLILQFSCHHTRWQMTALIKTCNTFSKFVNNTKQKRNVCINTHARAHSYMHKYSNEKFTYTQRHSYTQIFIYSIKCLMFYLKKIEKT